MKKNLRVITYNVNYNFSSISVRSVLGGMLSQTNSANFNCDEWKTVTEIEPNKKALKALELGWKIVKYIKVGGKSNKFVIDEASSSYIYKYVQSEPFVF